MAFQDQAMSMLNTIGQKITEVTQNILTSINDAGFLTNVWTARGLSLLIFLLVAYLIATFAKNMKPVIKWSIIIVVGLTALSIIIASFSGQ